VDQQNGWDCTQSADSGMGHNLAGWSRRLQQLKITHIHGLAVAL